MTLSCRVCWALDAIQARLRPSERQMAFLDDIYCVSSPERTARRFHRNSEIVADHWHQGPCRKDTVVEQIWTSPSWSRGIDVGSPKVRSRHLFAHGRARRDSVGDASGTSSICLVAIGSCLGKTTTSWFPCCRSGCRP